MKKIIHYPIISKIGSGEELMVEMQKVSKRFKHPVEKLKYNREIFYLKSKNLNKSEWGWTDIAQITFYPNL